MINRKHHKTPLTASTMFSTDKYFDETTTRLLYKKTNTKIKSKCVPHTLLITGKYLPGEQSHLHMDIPFVEYNKYTLLIYLNDNFDGGETAFYDNNFKIKRKICPKKGDGVIFNVDTYHQGLKVMNGNKYFLMFQLKELPMNKIKTKT